MMKNMGNDMRRAPMANRNPSVIPAFMPGQKGLLADQLNAGFGGGADQWSGILGQFTSPMKMGQGFKFGQGAGGGGNGGGNQAPIMAPNEIQIAQTYSNRGGLGGPPGMSPADYQDLMRRYQEYLASQKGK